MERRILWGTITVIAGSLLLALGTLPTDLLVLDALRTVIGVAFVTIVPGYLIRDLIPFREPSLLETVFTSVGLSLLYCLGLSLLIDLLFVGVAGSLQGSVFTGTLICTVGILTVVSVRRGARTRVYQYRELVTGPRFWRSFTLLTVLPLLSAVGAFFVNNYGFNGIMLSLIAIVAVLPVLLWTEGIPRELEAYAIYCAALAVLYHTTLISPHIWGWDTHYEYSSALQLLEQGYWAPDSRNPLSSLLTVTLLSGLYSKVTGLSLGGVFKLVYPLIFSLMPVGLYKFSKQLFDDRSIAVLSPFFAIFYYGFFKVIPGKQAFAETFFALMLLAIVMGGGTRFKRRVLVVIFLTAVVLSHYTTAFLFLLFLGVTYTVLTALTTLRVLEEPGRYTFVRPMFLVLFGTIWVFWFMYTADGTNFDRVVSVAHATVQSIFDPISERSGVAYATRSYGSFLWTVQKGLYAVMIGLGGVGILREAVSQVSRGTIDSRGEYAVFGSVVYAFLGSSAVLTYGLGFDRILQISLVVLAPFVTIGGRWLAALFVDGTGLASLVDRDTVSTGIAVFLTVMFVFSSGAVFAATDTALPKHSIGLDVDAGFPVYTENEVDATRWADDHLPACGRIGVYSDRSRANSRDGLLVAEVFPQDRIEPVSPDRSSVANSTYMYVSDRPLDLSTDLGRYINPRGTRYHSRVLTEASVIYASDEVRIYHHDRGTECP